MLWGKCLNGCIKELNIAHGPVLSRWEELEGNKEYRCDTKPRASTQMEIAVGCECVAGFGCSGLDANMGNIGVRFGIPGRGLRT